MYVPLRINDMNFSLKPKVQAGTIYDVTIPVGTIFRALFTEDSEEAAENSKTLLPTDESVRLFQEASMLTML